MTPTPRDLTADKLTWLRNEVGNDQRHGLASTRVDHNDLVSLLAMASRLLELEAALKDAGITAGKIAAAKFLKGVDNA